LLLEFPRAEEFVALINKRLKKKTARHSIAVAEYLADIADAVGVPVEQAVYAGLLHDIGKGMDEAELLEAAKRYGLAVNEVQREKPKLLHGAVAAEILPDELGIDDEDVLEAIRWHTTGRPGLCRLGLALYVADFAEPLRDHPEAAQARTIFEKDGFDEALWYVSSEKLRHIRSKSHMDPITEKFHAWLKSERT